VRASELKSCSIVIDANKEHVSQISGLYVLIARARNRISDLNSLQTTLLLSAHERNFSFELAIEMKRVHIWR